MDNWNWTEVSDDEFEKRRMNETYYRIFHHENGKDKVDYKFWEMNDESALNVLCRFKDDHKDGIEYFYSTSGYYSCSGKRYDTMEEMHEDYKKSEYTEDDRKLDIERILDYKKDIVEFDTIPLFNKCNLKFENITRKQIEYKLRKEKILKKIDDIDLSNLTENEYDEIIGELHAINQIRYDIQDFEYLITNEHKRTESWSIYDHILDDLEYNLPILIKDKWGIPTAFCVKAAEKLGTMRDDKYEFSDEENKLALDMWNEELEKLLLNVKLYRYYEGYGIINENNNEEVEFNNKWKNTIPYMNGTDKQLDYKKLDVLSTEKWNFIWDWIKQYGRCLWD